MGKRKTSEEEEAFTITVEEKSSISTSQLEDINIRESSTSTLQLEDISIGESSASTSQLEDINTGQSSTSTFPSTLQLEDIIGESSTSTFPSTLQLEDIIGESSTSQLEDINIGESSTSTSTPLLENISIGESFTSTCQLEDINIGESSLSTSTPLLENISIGESSTSICQLENINIGESSTSTFPSTLQLEDIIGESSTSTSQLEDINIGESSTSTFPSTLQLEDIIGESSTSTSQLEDINIGESSTSTSTPLLENISIGESSTSTCQLENINIGESSRCTPQLENISIRGSKLEDIITEDGILCSIISSLPLREAILTCVLSHRWRNIWTYLPRLNFDAKNMLDAHTAHLTLPDNKTLTKKERFELLEEKRDQFIHSVDSVLQQHQGRARVDEFVIRYYIPKMYSHRIDAWVRFAVTSKAKKLHILLHKPYVKEIETEPYEFPWQLIGFSSCIEELSLSCCTLKRPFEFDGLSHLKELTLVYIDVREEDINNLLSNCYKLQTLKLWKLPQLVSLSIPCPLSQLQNLTVKECDQLREIKINAVNLSRLCYLGPPVDFLFRQSSQLKYAKVFFRIGQTQHNLDFYLNKLSRNLPHLQTLVFHNNGVSKVVDSPKGYCSFIHLRCLKWIWNTNAKMNLPLLASVLDTAPLLEELKLQLLLLVAEPLAEVSEPSKVLSNHNRNHLKKIEISGFSFEQWQIEIALYLLNNAAELKTFTIEKGSKHSMETYEAEIKNLSQEVPSSVKLVVF